MFKPKIKNPKWFMKKVEVKESTVDLGGLGVFATELIEKHEMFESSPVLIWHRDLLLDYFKLNGGKHLLTHHIFLWEGPDHAFCLGYGTIYNHSNNPNALHRLVTDKKCPRIEFIAKREIQPGEEIFHHYAPQAGDLVFADDGSYERIGYISDLEKQAWSHNK